MSKDFLGFIHSVLNGNIIGNLWFGYNCQFYTRKTQNWENLRRPLSVPCPTQWFSMSLDTTEANASHTIGFWHKLTRKKLSGKKKALLDFPKEICAYDQF